MVQQDISSAGHVKKKKRRKSLTEHSIIFMCLLWFRFAYSCGFLFDRKIDSGWTSFSVVPFSYTQTSFATADISNPSHPTQQPKINKKAYCILIYNNKRLRFVHQVTADGRRFVSTSTSKICCHILDSIFLVVEIIIIKRNFI